MKKLLLMLLCLFVVSVFATVAFASSDVGDIANNDSIQISDNPNADISIPVNMTSPDNTDPSEAISVEPDANQTIQNKDSSVTAEDVNVEPANQIINNDTFSDNGSSKNAPELNITGPKINGSNLHINGPKIPKDGPKITLSQMDKDIYHFARIFCEHPNWDLYDCIDHVRFHSSYHWHEISIVVAKAHNIALHKYKGKEIMVLGWDITPESVDFRSKNFYGWK
jgi:hypothetical protein